MGRLNVLIINRGVIAISNLEKYFSWIHQVKEVKAEKEKALEDKEDIQNRCEKQMNELCATLEKYKVTGDDLLAVRVPCVIWS